MKPRWIFTGVGDPGVCVLYIQVCVCVCNTSAYASGWAVHPYTVAQYVTPTSHLCMMHDAGLCYHCSKHGLQLSAPATAASPHSCYPACTSPVACFLLLYSGVLAYAACQSACAAAYAACGPGFALCYASCQSGCALVGTMTAACPIPVICWP